ncbi:MAG: sigma-70 family RNA polymerase sigma factor [Marinifilaceae bacterium]|nr:sigma-70 family RNA polymerase sigma factor [Marinifilaceae bacterium]
MEVIEKHAVESKSGADVKLSEKAMKDYVVVRSAINGDERAFRELFARYRESVYFMILKMVNNRTDAEDLTFEAFEKAFSNLVYYSPQYAFSTWLFKIASNNTIDFIRKRKNLTVSLDKDDANQEERSFAHTIAADILDPEQQAIREQRALYTREKVSMLKGRYRRLIELRYFDELSYEEIAEELNIPLGTVKAQLFRARELLMNLLKSSELRDGE